MISLQKQYNKCDCGRHTCHHVHFNVEGYVIYTHNLVFTVYEVTRIAAQQQLGFNNATVMTHLTHPLTFRPLQQPLQYCYLPLLQVLPHSSHPFHTSFDRFP